MKRFYNNTLIGGAFSKALRVVALLCVLLGFSSSAWGDTYYIDASCISGVQQISWLQYQNNSGNNSGNIVSQNTNFNGKTAFQFTADAGKTLKLQLKIVSGNTIIYPQLYNINLSGSNNCIELSLDGSTLSYKAKQGSTLKCAGGCTPSATITGASYDGTQITLSGTVTEVCTSSIATWYGWQYKTDVNAEWSTSTYIAGKAGSNQHQTTTSPVNYTNTWTGFEEGKTYYFRAYALQGSTWYSDNKILSVTIPNGGGSTGEADCSGVVYLDPNIYVGDDAWFAAYFFGNEDIWVEMTPACDGLYKAMIPDGATGVTFVRKNPADKTLESWNNKWNQTVDLQIQTNKYFKVENWKAKDGKETGTWYDTDCTDGCIPAEQPSTNVLLSREAIVNKSAKTAQLFGYLKSIKAPDCPSSAITDYGFFYCMVNDGDTPCLPTSTSSSTKIAADPSPALSRGMEFTATVGLIKEPSDALQDGKTYYYRAYAKIDDQYILSGEIRSFSTDPCIPQYGGLSDKYNGKPIVYTINADPSFAPNDCKLHFNSLQDAIDHLKKTKDRDNDYKYVDGSYNLLQPVEMRVVYYDDTPDDETKAYAYRGTTQFGMTAGNVNPTHVNLIEDINKDATNKANTLTIKAGTSTAKPWIHHIVIRNSKNIVLDSLCIYSDISGKGDNALEIDVNSKDWGRLDIDPTISSVAPMLDANITIQNSMIGSAGFTGVHISCYGGITFKNNDFECTYPGTEDNALRWGASAKFLACKDVKFIQNNFRGSQTTLLWIQECHNMLFMNNVFWNTNTNSTDKDQPIAAVRLVHQFDTDTNDYKKKSKVKNISFFYNTFYLADDKKPSSHKYNFYCLSNSYDAHSTVNEFDLGSLYFKYNNCYSYDENLAGRSNNSGAFLGIDLSEHANFCPNNFWSQYDEVQKNTTSAFAFGCSDNTFTNVKTQVCETTASGPASLIVKGQAMNTGKKLTDSDISSTGIELTANELTSDRYLIGVRPNDDTWTMGAYQSKDNIETQVIYWVGISSDWDDRNNWEYETEVDGKMVRQRVSCVNILSEDLKVVVEEIGTVEVDGGRKWPKVPASFDANYRKENSNAKVPVAEQVSITDKYASTIELEYGAGIRGVENLKEKDGTRRYDKAIVHFDADREKWLLVGTVVKPFVDENDTDGEVRNIKSGDYFKDYLPQVYMRETEIDTEGNVSWTKTFSDLETYVTPNTVFAIDVRDKYGPNFLSADTYNSRYGTSYNGKEPIPYRFTGRFAVEAEKAQGEDVFAFDVTPGVKNLLNNNYPCNIDAVAIEQAGLGTINLYDYVKGSFVCTDAKGDSYTAQDSAANAIPPVAYIKAQNGFVFTPKAGLNELVISDYLVGGNTRTRSTERELPTFSLDIDNANTTAPGASNVVVRYDEEMDVTMEAPLNTPKVFTKTMDTPEAYIMHNDSYYSRLYVGNGVTRIPLGIRLRKAMNVTFQKVYNKGFSSMILLDTQTGKEYDLLTRSYTTNLLPKGDTEGRFYLVFSVIPEDEYLPDDDMTTGVDEEVETANADINIYTVNGNTIRVVTNDVNLQTIYVSDMVGRTAKYEAEGNFAEIELPVVNGVYTVQVIGDKLTRNEKVIIK